MAANSSLDRGAFPRIAWARSVDVFKLRSGFPAFIVFVTGPDNDDSQVAARYQKLKRQADRGTVADEGEIMLRIVQSAAAAAIVEPMAPSPEIPFND
ncbi:MAG: hypothetical protein JO128_22225 [Alphaproteobacteria bacterium]|nr:hypothetical protein [Alphaproteobacteria bacterium]